MNNKEEKVLIVDGLSIFIPSYIVNPTLSPNGEPIGAVVGFMKSLQKMLRELKPISKVIICWDGSKGTNRRRSMNEGYKSNRKALRLNRDSLGLTEEASNKANQQMRLIEYLNQMPVIQLMFQSSEADDVVAAVLNEMHGEKCIIASSDKDYYQLLSENVSIYNPNKKSVYTVKDLKRDYKISPENFALAKAICGDKSDNIHGIPRMGFKTLMKKAPFFADERGYTIKEVIELEKDTEFGKVLQENRNKVLDNYKIVQLYYPYIPYEIKKHISETLEEYPYSFNKTEIRKMLYQDGLTNSSWSDLFVFLNNIGEK